MPAKRRAADEPAANWLVVAELGRAHGLRGEIGGRLSGVTPDELMALPDLRLRSRGGEPVPVRVESARPKKGVWILAISGIRDRTAAEGQSGGVLLARRQDLPEPDAGEWYVADLVGLSVETEGGEELGNLEEVLQLPANDVMIVRGERGEILVPVLEEVIREVDQEAGRMIVRLPVGLLDIAEPRSPDVGPGEQGSGEME